MGFEDVSVIEHSDNYPKFFIESWDSSGRIYKVVNKYDFIKQFNYGKWIDMNFSEEDCIIALRRGWLRYVPQAEAVLMF